MEITVAVETWGTFHDDMSDHIFRFKHQNIFQRGVKGQKSPKFNSF